MEITIESDQEETEVDFTKVPDGTTEAQFRDAIAKAVSGEALPELLEFNVGVSGTTKSITETVILRPGQYFVWAEPASDDSPEGDEAASTTTSAAPSTTAAEGGEEEGEEPTKPEEFLVSAATVGEGTGELPETDGTITARDYSFDIEVKAGDKFTFVNDGPKQFHHAILLNFGSLDAKTVEDNLQAFLEAEGEGEGPAAFKDLDPSKVFIGGTGVNSPDGKGTFSASLETGNTYAAVCFINDRDGGPPHAFKYDMTKVFSVED